MDADSPHEVIEAGVLPGVGAKVVAHVVERVEMAQGVADLVFDLAEQPLVVELELGRSDIEGPPWWAGSWPRRGAGTG
jgi:hypothetical protein